MFEQIQTLPSAQLTESSASGEYSYVGYHFGRKNRNDPTEMTL